MFDARFGTKEPVTFREYDESYKYTDLTVTARITGTAVVSDYDKERYKSGDEVIAAVRENATELLQKSLDLMPVGKSIVNSDKSAVAELFAKELEAIGITAEVQFRFIALLPESEELLNNMAEIEKIAKADPDRPYGVFPGDEDTREPGTFRVNYEPVGTDIGFSSAKRYYAPGENVEVVYNGILSDSKCFFFADAAGYSVQYEDSYTAKVTFLMPAHDVDVLVYMKQMRFGLFWNDQGQK